MAVLYIPSILSKASIFIAFLHKINLQNRCRVMGRLCFLVAICSVLEFYKRAFHAFVGFLLMSCLSFLKVLMIKYNDYGCGFLVVWCFMKICHVLVVFFMFILGFKVLKFGGHFKFSKPAKDNCVGHQKDGGNDCVMDSSCDFFEENDEEEEEEKKGCDEDQVFDVMSLRKMVKAERHRANVACTEIEKERIASASAAAEAMAMILRLQNEKSSLQMQVNQLKRLDEEKQLYDQDVIQSLQWIVMKHESERSLLEDRLRMCREKLKLYVKDEEWDQLDCVFSTPSASGLSDGCRFEDLPISSLDLEFSPM